MRDEMRAKPLGAEVSKQGMEEIWAAAAEAFEKICGKSLQKGDVRGFADLRERIEAVGVASYDADPEEQDKWKKAKGFGLESLKYLKGLVYAASQASSFIPIPGSVANVTCSALCFVFDIPQAIKGYNDAINQVFSDVSSALSQFQIYTSMEKVDPALIQQIHLVMISFVKICAHVVKYRQGSRRVRLLHQIKSVFDDDSGLADELNEFKRVLQQQRDVEGTITLAVVVEQKHEFASFLDIFTDFKKTTEDGVRALNADADRTKTLAKIRDTLSVTSKVRLDTNTTQTCVDIHERCLPNTGSWIWEHDSYTAWTAANKDREVSHVLLLSGPSSSGKTLASALITKRLEEQKGRTFVAHYFFPASTKKSDDEKNPMQSALKYMAFQIARVDSIARKALGKACETEPGAFRSSSSLDKIWRELKIGGSGSGAVYYLVFDGLEHLPYKETELLLAFVFGSGLAAESAGRVRVLLSGTNDQFTKTPWIEQINNALRIRMEENNGPDMRIVIDDALTKRGMLQHAKPGSDQQKARDKILEKLPQKVSGSYSILQFGLNDVTRSLSTRIATSELDRMLDQPMSSHEAAIKDLQRSLSVDEINELNELLKWVLFSNTPLTLEQLEGVMFLYSDTESLASLEYIIQSKYSAVFKVEDYFVYGRDGVKEYLQKEAGASSKLSHSKDRATISMTITINNVDQELCGHFLWDLAHKAIRDKFRFDFDTASLSGAFHNSGQTTIAVDEFEAHHTIVNRAFKFLDQEPSEQTKEIGVYLTCWLPYHLGRLRRLEDEDKGALTRDEQSEIVQNLYRLFKDGLMFSRHRESFKEVWWEADEMLEAQEWLMDSAVLRKLDGKWRDEIRLATRPTRGFLKALVKLIVEGSLRGRNWTSWNTYYWIAEFMKVDERQVELPKADDAEPPGSGGLSPNGTADEIDWVRVSAWCQDYLEMPDPELDSLWYECLAEISLQQLSEAGIVISFYQRAIEKGTASWLCHRDLGRIYFREERIKEAIVEAELALKGVEQESASPEPEPKDIVELNLLLAKYVYEAGNAQRAAKLYTLSCKSEDLNQVMEGRVGYLKARLGFADVEETRLWLKNTFNEEDGEAKMVEILKEIARDPDHDTVIPRMFTLAKEESDLFKRIVRAMEIATTTPTPYEDRVDGMTGDDLFAENESRGVLLYDRGVAAYTYGVSPNGTEAVSEALRLWKESREILSKVGGHNASTAWQDATTALAQHYFHNMVDGGHLDHTDALAKLVGPSSMIDHNGNSIALLGALYALQGRKEEAKATLMPQMIQALQILSDDMPENDSTGFWMLRGALGHFLDFESAAIALSFRGQPDLITDKLYFEAGDNDIKGTECANKDQLLDVVANLAKETIQIVKDQFPKASQQLQRMKAAEAHIDSLVAASKTKSDPEADSDNNEATGSEDLDSAAHKLLHSRISSLRRIHEPKINSAFIYSWTCDGRTPDGKHCKNWGDFEHDFYHCIYCADCDFCGDCLGRLRANSNAQVSVCSAKHRWMRIPPLGEAMYVGPRAKSAPVPKEVRPMKGDENILEICYDEDGGKEINLGEWKEALAKEWNISLKDIKEEASRQTTPTQSE
ncbi:uncharacterized protein F4822DRAFT_416709 [Hypoxylon trugodes]|uniref:uncharacterized protein n=1 Tax=Hypoxylon trugodes TaxID=326681 RepID=UPI0021938269|nr:uncharacterized protein F4822DRAFT_416709 [Hypoxylon trugodes]KAI1384920.1 hypothetical protein F4822DRAFT_416709 [Hypoxylon trugodes]